MKNIEVLDTVEKDPQAIRTYTIDWAKGGPNDASADDRGYLQGDTISSSTWSVDSSDITIIIDGNTTTTAYAKISGGVLGRRYYLTNHIVLATSGDEDERTLEIIIVNK